MTLVFTIENAVLLALAQVGVIVMSVAGSMVSKKLVKDVALPWLTILFVEYGIVLLLLPLVWITCALLVRRHARASDEMKNLMFATGVFLVILLVVLGGTAAIQPLLMAHAPIVPEDDPGE